MAVAGKSFPIWTKKSGSRKKFGKRILFIYFNLCHSFSFLNSVTSDLPAQPPNPQRFTNFLSGAPPALRRVRKEIYGGAV